MKHLTILNDFIEDSGNECLYDIKKSTLQKFADRLLAKGKTEDCSYYEGLKKIKVDVSADKLFPSEKNYFRNQLFHAFADRKNKCWYEINAVKNSRGNVYVVFVTKYFGFQ